jgi:hypothetical protein
MGVTVWDRFSTWAARGKLEEGFEDGAGIQIKLSSGETVPAEVRVGDCVVEQGLLGLHQHWARRTIVSA